MNKKYPPHIDFLSKFITIVILVVMVMIIKTFLTDITLIKIVGLAILILSFFIVLSFFPIYYIINNDELVIKRIIADKTITIKSMTNVSKLNTVVSFTYSTKGFLGYLGKTMDGTISCSTSLKNNILIKTDMDLNIIISPKNSD